MTFGIFPKRHNAECDFDLPDVHLFSVYLLIEVLQEGNKSRN